MQNSTATKDEIRSSLRAEQVPISEGSYRVNNSDSWHFSEHSLPLNSDWTSMSTDIDPSAECEYETSVSQEQNFHQKLMTTSERMERMQEKMDDLESKFQEITKYLQENPSSPENEISQPIVKEWHRQLCPELRDHLIRKLVHAILRPTGPCEDRIVKKLDAYAKKIENISWEAANSKAEYYHLLAEKYYKIIKELDERRRRRINARRL